VVVECDIELYSLTVVSNIADEHSGGVLIAGGTSFIHASKIRKNRFV
jgi:hypothetical protein